MLYLYTWGSDSSICTGGGINSPAERIEILENTLYLPKHIKQTNIYILALF